MISFTSFPFFFNQSKMHYYYNYFYLCREQSAYGTFHIPQELKLRAPRQT